MIISGTSPPITIDLDNSKPGMTLQYQDIGWSQNRLA
jgi:hypothetical protein